MISMTIRVDESYCLVRIFDLNFKFEVRRRIFQFIELWGTSDERSKTSAFFQILIASS